MVEVVVDVGGSLDETESYAALGEVEVRLALPRTVDLEVRRQPRKRTGQVGDAERDVTKRSALSRALRVEQRDLAAARVRSEQREPLRPVDDVHAEIRRDELSECVSAGDPVRDVVELRRLHDLDGTPTPTRYTGNYVWSSGVFWTLCSVA